MALSIRDDSIIKVVQNIRHQGDVRQGTFKCSCMCLSPVNQTFFKSPRLWNKFDLDWILGNGDQLFKFIYKFRYLGIEDLSQEFFIENCSLNVELLKNMAGKTTAGIYIQYIAEIVGNVQQIQAGAVLIINNYILGLIYGNDSIYLFDSKI